MILDMYLSPDTKINPHIDKRFNAKIIKLLDNGFVSDFLPPIFRTNINRWDYIDQSFSIGNAQQSLGLEK